MADWINRLYCGDNLDILREHMEDESVDLMYLDPPFNSNVSYSARPFPRRRTRVSIRAFDDVWRWNAESEAAYAKILEEGPRPLSHLLQGLRRHLDRTDMLAYLTMFCARLPEIRRVLKPSGTMYLHCDPTAAHYLKVVADTVFGRENFLNEIIWHYEGPQSPSRTRFATKHDLLLRYAKRREAVDVVRDGLYRDVSLTEEEARKKGYRRDECGRWYYDTPTGDYTEQSIQRLESQGRIRRTASGKPRVKHFLKVDERGRVVRRKKLSDVWSDIPSLGLAASSREKTGYPTQKPERLLRRIVAADSRAGDLVVDPFCGSGTTLAIAEELDRRWLGMDTSYLAMAVCRHRLNTRFGPRLTPHEVIGGPKTLQKARALAESEPEEFQLWALGMLGALPRREDADSGIEGWIECFHGTVAPAAMLIQVRPDGVGAHLVRDLREAMDRNNADMGAIVTAAEPTNSMRREARAAGFYESPGRINRALPKVQILTAADLLEGKTISPSHSGRGR